MEENKSDPPQKEEPPKTYINWQGVGSAMLILVCLFGFGIFALQPWILGIIIGVILSANASTTPPRSVIEKQQRKNDLRKVIIKDPETLGGEYELRHRAHPVWEYTMPSERWMEERLKADREFIKNHDFKKYHVMDVPEAFYKDYPIFYNDDLLEPWKRKTDLFEQAINAEKEKEPGGEDWWLCTGPQISKIELRCVWGMERDSDFYEIMRVMFDIEEDEKEKRKRIYGDG